MSVFARNYDRHGLQKVIIEDNINQPQLLLQRLDTIGNGSGVQNMNVDGSINEQVFKIQPDAIKIMVISSVHFTLSDNGSIDSGGFGNNGGAKLQNGIIFGTYKNPIDFISNIVIHRHSDLVSIFNDDFGMYNFGAGESFITAHYNVRESGKVIVLDGSKSDYFYFKIRDDLRYLKSMYVTVNGYILDKK